MIPTSLAIEVQRLSVVLGGKRIIDIPALHITTGEVLTIIGPNGSGKTTLLLALALLLKSDTGYITYFGRTANLDTDALKLRRRFAVVFQEPLLLNTSVWENVTLGLRLRGITKNEMKRRASYWLARFGISELASRQAKTVSGGEAQRVSLARAFALEPDILFLDEPFSALDTPTHQSIVDDFNGVLHEIKLTTVMVTHDHDEALLLGDRIAVLMNGHLRQLGTPQEVFATPVDEEIASFIKVGNILHGKIISVTEGLSIIDVAGRILEAATLLAINDTVTVYLRYEDITLQLPAVEKPLTSARNKLFGRISRVVSMGMQVRVTVACPFPLTALITRRSCEELGMEVGKEIVATFKATALHLFKRASQRQ